MNKKIILYFVPLLVFIGLVVLLASGIGNDPTKLPSQLVNKPMPAFKLSELNSDKMVTAKDWQGQRALVNVWATWCPTCYAEHDYLMKLAQQGVIIYGIDYKDDSDEARQLLQRNGNPYRSVVADPNGELAIELGVYGAPETFVIDENGIILYRHVGEVNDRVWNQILKPLMQPALSSSAGGK